MKFTSNGEHHRNGESVLQGMNHGRQYRDNADMIFAGHAGHKNGFGTGIREEKLVPRNGIGIPESDLALIFEWFYRTDRSRSRKTGGVGIGLTIVKAIVTAHGGQVSAENRPEGGSRFTVSLPKSKNAHTPGRHPTGSIKEYQQWGTGLYRAEPRKRICEDGSMRNRTVYP